MPIHDWSRVRSNRFHDFHQRWMIAICNALNAGRLPEGYFAMVEQKVGGPEPDVISLALTPSAGQAPGGMSVALEPTKTRFVARTEAAAYARKANRMVVRQSDGEVVAVVAIVSPGNKDSQHAIRAFAREAVEFLLRGVHLSIVDLFPPSRLDPQGIHKIIWDRLNAEEPFALPPGKPLTVAAYTAGDETIAYVENAAVGDRLPDMPVFLAADQYAACPLEETYQTAWEQYPAPLKRSLESPPSN